LLCRPQAIGSVWLLYSRRSLLPPKLCAGIDFLRGALAT
jgi:hypothetical protein